MAIDYKAGQAPKGPSNSNPMASTPGTQQSALQNVGGLNLNPNMPAGPQMQKRGRSSYQQSVTPPAPRAPSQSGGPRQRMPGGRPTVSRGLPMDQGRGYNVFSGMDAGQISDMNRTMGMSNMTALPPVNPALSGMGLRPGEPTSRRLMSEGDLAYQATPAAPTAQSGAGIVSGGGVDITPMGDVSGLYDALYSGDPTSEEQEIGISQGQSDPDTYQEDLYKFYEDPYAGVEENLDQKYSIQLQSILAGLDRQAAMMGTFGSPAHTAMINQAISGALETMAGEYADLGVMESDTQMGLLDKVREVEDVKAAFFGDVQATSDLGTQIFSTSSINVESLDSPGQVAVFGDYLSTIATQFTKEFMNAANSDQAFEIYLKYQTINEQFNGLIAAYKQMKPKETVNTMLNDIFAQIGLGPDYAGDDDIYIDYF